MKWGIRPSEGGIDFSSALEQATYAESLGFDSVWFAEHYGPDEEWWPSPLLSLSAVATQTDEITIGTNILITPLYNPVWLAASTAQLDVISEGRFVCGLGVGYGDDEFAAFGVDRDERVGRLIETIDLLKAFWTGQDVDYHGRHYTIKGFRLEPKPIQEPRPEIWLGVWGDYLLKQAAERADAWIPGTAASFDEVAERNREYLSNVGPDNEPKTRPLLRDIIVADTDEEAIDLAQDRLHNKFCVYRERGHPAYQSYSGDHFEEFATARSIVGSVDTCIEQIEAYRDELNIDHFIFRFPKMAHEEILGTMDVIADEIVPQVPE